MKTPAELISILFLIVCSSSLSLSLSDKCIECVNVQLIVPPLITTLGRSDLSGHGWETLIISLVWLGRDQVTPPDLDRLLHPAVPSLLQKNWQVMVKWNSGFSWHSKKLYWEGQDLLPGKDWRVDGGRERGSSEGLKDLVCLKLPTVSGVTGWGVLASWLVKLLQDLYLYCLSVKDGIYFIMPTIFFGENRL